MSSFACSVLLLSSSLSYSISASSDGWTSGSNGSGIPWGFCIIIYAAGAIAAALAPTVIARQTFAGAGSIFVVVNELDIGNKRL